MRTICVVACAFIMNKHLLLVRKRNTSRFMLPGGKITMGETNLDCLSREVMEELGCQLNVNSLRFLGEFTAAAANETDSLVAAQIYRGQLQGDPVPSNEIEQICWLGRNDSKTLPIAPLVATWVLPRLLELNCL